MFNYSSCVLSEAEKYLLQNGLNFNILPKKLNHADYFVNFKLFYKDISNLEVLSAKGLDFIKMKFDALKNRHSLKQTETSKSQKKQIVIQKSEKGNSIVIVNRNKYIEKIENFLCDKSKFQKTSAKNDNFLNFITSHEKHIDKIFKKFIDSNSMSEET